MPRKLDYVTGLDDKVVGTRIKALRQGQGMSQVDLAQKLGMDQSLLSRYERGELRVHGALLTSLAKIFKTSTDEILGVKPVKNERITKDRRFLKRLQKIDQLSQKKKDALLTTIDSFIGDDATDRS